MEEERQLKNGARRASCATSTLIVKISVIRERAGSIRECVNLQVRALPEAPCAWDESIRNGERPDEYENDPDRPCGSKDTTRAASSRRGTCILQHRGCDERQERGMQESASVADPSGTRV